MEKVKVKGYFKTKTFTKKKIKRKPNTTITRKFSKLTKLLGSLVELDGHYLIDKKRIQVDVGDYLAPGDIITEYVIDDGRALLEAIYVKEFNPNHYPLADKVQFFVEKK